MQQAQQTAGAPLRLHKPDFWNRFDPGQEAALAPKLASLYPEPCSQAPLFTLQDGPPYANGDAHLGHFLNKFLKDAYARRAQGKGMRLLWRAGWDCHGLPLELACEKQLGAAAKGMPKDQFAEACRKLAEHWSERQKSSFARLGLAMDLQNPWKTMDPSYEAACMRLLGRLRGLGALCASDAPARWCPLCQSTLAASELEAREGTRLELGALAALDMPASARLLRLFDQASEPGPVHLAFWTTTPWTLPSNAAFAYPLQGNAHLLRLQNGKKALASDAGLAELSRRGLAAENLGCRDWGLLAKALGNAQAASPLSGQPVPAVPHALARCDQGLGCVHLAPAYGPEDHAAAMELGLAWGSHVEPDGTFGQGLPKMNLEDGSAWCAAALRERDLALFEERASCEAWACWRHGCHTFYKSDRGYALFLDRPLGPEGRSLKERALARLEQGDFCSDDRTAAALRRMLMGRSVWNLSRRRTWGVPFPLYLDAQTGQPHPDADKLWEECAKGTERHGAEFWRRMPELPGYRKETQVADVWFDSGASLWACDPAPLSAEFACEGKDQTRGWFLSTLLLSGAFPDNPTPLRKTLAHGFVVDHAGKKLAKSLGNAPDEAQAFRFGAEALRLWALSQNPKEEVAWSPKHLERAKEEQTSWRSLLRFFLANMAPSPAPGLAGCAGNLRGLDHAALSRLARAEEAWESHFSQGRPDLALAELRGLRQFMSQSWFELSKRLLYCAEDGACELHAVQAALRYAFLRLLRLLDPFMPFSARQALDCAGLDCAPHACDPFPACPQKALGAEQDLLLRDRLLACAEKLRQSAGKAPPDSALAVHCPAPADRLRAQALLPGLWALPDPHASEPRAQFLPNAPKCPRCRTFADPQEQAGASPGGLCPDCATGWRSLQHLP